jgi:hypothetical protein
MPIRRYIVTSTFDGVLSLLCQVPRSALGHMPIKHSTKDGVKATQLRVWKALLMLLVAMTSGAMVLMALGNNPPSAGAFCLSSYYKLASAEQALMSNVVQEMGRWKRIEVCYSGTKGGNIEWLAHLQGLSDSQDLECHFVICNGILCNGLGGEDGQILTTERWYAQQSVCPSQYGTGDEETIRICVVADGRSIYATDCQRARVRALTDTLCTRFWIGLDSVSYPADMVATQPR